MFEKLRNIISEKIAKSVMKIYPAHNGTVSILETVDFETNAAINKIWFRGDASELSQLYRQLPDSSCSFWGAKMTQGNEIRKIHIGLPGIMVNVLAGIITDDLQELKLEDENIKKLWKEIENKCHFKKAVKKAVLETLVTGDGAFKISLDSSVSEYPFLEFFGADRIEIIRSRGTIKEIIFKTPYYDGTREYTLFEHYGTGYINYILKDSGGNKVPLETLPYTSNLVNVKFEGNFMLADYISFYDSGKWDGRGRSIFDSKRGNFDSIDEIYSQWVDAVRAGRAKTYIPEMLLPRRTDGSVMRGNSFDNRFIRLESDVSENGKNEIKVVQPDIPHESYLSAYVTALDLCLQGIISPSTLGIDTKKLDNAEAQREKEKTTLYTRQTIINAIQPVLSGIVLKMLNSYRLANKKSLYDIKIDVTFGEYANPSFESQIETVSKGHTAGIMSIEACLDELYGDTKSDTWKKEEADRLRKEQGLFETDEPALNLDFNNLPEGE